MAGTLIPPLLPVHPARLPWTCVTSRVFGFIYVCNVNHLGCMGVS